MIQVDQVFKIKNWVTAEHLSSCGYKETKVGLIHRCHLPFDDIYSSVSIDMHTRVVTVMIGDTLEVLLPLMNMRALEYNENVVEKIFNPRY